MRLNSFAYLIGGVMRRFLFGLLFLSLSAQAEIVHLACDSQELYHLKITVDKDDLFKSPSTLGFANISFYFINQTYNWTHAQKLTSVLKDGDTASLFRYNSQNRIYLKYSAQSDEAFAVLDLYRNHFELECKFESTN